MMKTRLRQIGLLGLALLVAGAGYVGFRLVTTLSKKNLTETVALPGCRLIPGAIGPEDIQYVPDADGLVVSSMDRRNVMTATGQLFWLDLAAPVEQQALVPLDSKYPERFAPHGIAYQKTSDTGGRLFVISHRLQAGNRHPIEVFTLDFKSGTPELTHDRTLADDLLISPNDLAALPDGTVFIANDFQDVGGGFAGQVLDTIFERTRAPLVYYDGQQFHDLHENVSSANGLGYVKRGTEEYLYQPDFMRKRVQKFSVQRTAQGFPTLVLEADIELGSGPDNFTLDDEGNVYVAAHYSIGLVLATAADAAVQSPSQIFRIAPDDSVSLVYANRGGEFSAASVAQVVGNRLILGQIYDDGLLSCPFPLNDQ